MKNLCTLLLVTFLLFGTHSKAQKLIKNEKDRFTQAITKVTSKEKIWRNTALGGLIDVYAQSVGGTMSLWLVIHERHSFIITAGDRLYLALEDGNSVQLNCVNGAVSKRGENLWHGTVGYRVTEEDYEALIASTATAIRIDEGDKYIEKEIKERLQGRIDACLKLVH